MDQTDPKKKLRIYSDGAFDLFHLGAAFSMIPRLTLNCIYSQATCLTYAVLEPVLMSQYTLLLVSAAMKQLNLTNGKKIKK
jgi:hypothetical protein